jgi:enoyl-CoA hydratase/carnithine racemase
MGQQGMTQQVLHERVTLAFQDHVAEVALVRPHEHNGLDWAMIDACWQRSST